MLALLLSNEREKTKPKGLVLLTRADKEGAVLLSGGIKGPGFTLGFKPVDYAIITTMKNIIPPKLKKGDKISIIAPASSFSFLSDETVKYANKNLADLGFELVFGKNINESNEFGSSSIESRIEDLYWAFENLEVRGILTVLGGFNSNQLLEYIDWDLIASNPKVFCGYSDITALCNAIYAKTGLVTYYGPHYSTFGQKYHLDYTVEYFKKCLIGKEEYIITPSEKWSDDRWYIDQEDRNLIDNQGYWIVNEGEAAGTIIGGNQCTLNLLQGTEYMPEFKEDTILFLEDDYEVDAATLDRDLQSLIHLPYFKNVKGLVFGRAQIASEISRKLFEEVIRSKPELDDIPVVGNVDFGHTDPRVTFPIGGGVELDIRNDNCVIKVLVH